MAMWEGEDGVKIMQGAGASGIWSPSVTQERSTSRNEGSRVESPSTSSPQRSGPDSKVCTSSKPPFSPSVYTTWSPYCKSLCTSSWQRCPHVHLHGAPLTMALR